MTGASKKEEPGFRPESHPSFRGLANSWGPPIHGGRGTQVPAGRLPNPSAPKKISHPSGIKRGPAGSSLQRGQSNGPRPEETKQGIVEMTKLALGVAAMLLAS